VPNIRDIVGYVETHDWGFTQGHRLCPGCNAPMVANWATLAAKSMGYEPVVGAATGCLEVSSTIYPFTSWNVPYIHNAFENVAATISGAEAAYRSLLNRGKIDNDKIKFIAFAGDGGTYDIGLQSLSGAIERGHDFVYILYDNEGYMNTGNQRSGSTPLGADSTTAPVGKAISGKLQLKKSIVDIVAGHEGVYAATAATAEPWDFMRKMQTALEFKGPSFIAMLAPCVRFWRIPDDSGPEVTKLAIETKYWPLWEYNMGVYRVTKKPKTFKPIKDYVTKLGRYSKLMKRPDANEIVEELQNYVDAKWDRLLALEEITKDKPLRTKI